MIIKYKKHTFDKNPTLTLMISLPTYHLPLSFKQFFRNYLKFRPTSKNAYTKEQKHPDLSGSSFLIVSDDPFTSFVFGRYIEKWNGNVDIASSEMQAREDISNGQYKGILVDINLVKKSNGNVLSEDLIKALSAQKLSKLIALVDENSESLKAELFNAGIKDWLEKEINPSELSEKLYFYTR